MHSINTDFLCEYSLVAGSTGVLSLKTLGSCIKQTHVRIDIDNYI